ncbi:MAG: B12-binding domain-containing radical SAM protein [Anaerolineales bacterium]|nr:B12-binding domain-containing radical SAM protein [Anaerolineales bacterium]
MDILLAHGYYLSEDPAERKVMKPYPTLGLLYLSAYLKRAGFNVGMFDSTFDTLDSFISLTEQQKPAVIGLYCNMMTKFNILKMIAASKHIGAIVVLGGPEPANYAEEYLTRGADVIVLGEGESTLEELLPSLARHKLDKLDVIAGIVFQRDDGALVRTLPRAQIADLDSLPDPDREAIDLQMYMDTWKQHHGMSSISLITARGCPYHCEWCSHAVYGHTHRRRSVNRVVDEVEFLLGRYQPDQLWYADDVFTIKHSWFFEYAAELKRRNIRIPFECISRADRLNEQVIQTLADIGCSRLWIGSESGSQTVLDNMRREVKVEQVQAMTHMLRKYGIQTGMFIMLGYEGEEVADIEATADHLKKAAPDVFLTTLAYPIKGTPYYQKVENRILARSSWDERSDRQLSVVGRRSRRYYSFANRWLVNTVLLDREKKGTANPLKVIKAKVNEVIGRAGMWMTNNEREVK